MPFQIEIFVHNIELPFQRSLSSWFSEFVEKKLEGEIVFCEIDFPETCFNKFRFLTKQQNQSQAVLLIWVVSDNKLCKIKTKRNKN